MTRRSKKNFFLILVMALLTSVGFGLIPVNLFFAKNAISELARQNLGVELEFHGPLSLRLGFSPELSASSLQVHVHGTDDHPLVGIEQLVVEPVLSDLLNGDVHLRNLGVLQAVVNYCPDVMLDPGSDPENSDTPMIAIDRLVLETVQLVCNKPDRSIALMPGNIHLEMKAGLNEPLHAELSGLILERKTELTITTVSLNELLSATVPVSVDALLRGFDSSLQINGDIHDLFDNPSLAAQVSIDTRDPSIFLGLAGIEASFTDPTNIRAEFIANSDSIEIKSLDASLGPHHFSAKGLVDGFHTRPNFQLSLQIPKLDGSLIKGESETASSNFVLSDFDIRPWLADLKSFDTDLEINIGTILNSPLVMDNIYLSAGLKNGRLSIDQSHLRVEDSLLSLTASLDTTASCPEMAGELHWSNIDLGVVSQFLESDTGVSGHLESATTNIRSCGFSPGDHARSIRVISDIDNAKISHEAIEFPVVLDNLAVETGFAEPGRIVWEGNLLGEHISGDVRLGSVSQILSESTWPLSLKSRGVGADIQMEGNAALVEGRPWLNGHLNINIGRVGELYRWVDVDPASALAASAQADIYLDQDSWTVSAINVGLGQSNLNGSVSGKYNQSESRVMVSLNSQLMNTIELMSLMSTTSGEESSAIIDDNSNQGETGWIDDLLSVPTIDYEFSVGKFAGLELEIKNLNVMGRIRDRLIEDHHLEVSIEGIEISGDVDADLRLPPWKLAYTVDASNLDIGRLLSRLDIAQDVNAQAEHANFEFSSEGQTMGDLVSNARLETRLEQFSIRSDLFADDSSTDHLHLPLVEFTAAPSRKTEWSAVGSFNAVPVKLWLQTPHMSRVLDATSDLDLRFAVSAGRDLAIVDALINRDNKDHLEAEFVLSGQTFDTADIFIADITQPLEDYELRSRLIIDGGIVRLTELEARLGTSWLSGDLQIDNSHEITRLSAQLRSPYLETDDLTPWMEGWRQVDSAEKLAKTKATLDPEMTEGFLTVINRAVDEFTNKKALDIGIEIEKLHSSGSFLGSAQMQFVLDDRKLHISPLRIVMPDGNVEAEYFSLKSESGAEAKLDLEIKSLEYGGLLKLADPDSTANGLLYVDTSLEATAPTWEQIPANIDGHLNLLLFPEDVNSGFLNLWATSLIFALLPVDSDKKKSLNCLAAPFNIENGVMKSKKILLDTTDVIVNGRGSIDLVRQELDLLFAPQAKLEKFLSVTSPIKVKGPFSDFQAGITTSGLAINAFKWYLSLIYVPFKWLTGERFPADGKTTCFSAMDWEVP